ncbi:MAG TPA: cupredoxin domain-containing protein [Acidimicrobiales bacterium]
MFNAASKTAYTLGVAAIVAGFAAVLATSDRVAFASLVFAGVLAAAIGLAVFWYAPRDPVVPVSAEVEAATSRRVDVTDVARPSPWPLVAALAIALFGVGAALGKGLIVIGIVVSFVAGLAWLAQSWREHPSWTTAMTQRVNDRYVVPLGLPAVAILSVAVAAVSLSRIFLAVSKEAAPIIGSIIAFALLGAFYLLSKMEQIGRSVIATLAAVSTALVIGAGVAGALKGEREFHKAETDGAVVLKADDLAFDTNDLQLPTQAKLAIRFENEDSEPHNFSIYREKGGEALFEGEIIKGGEHIDYELTTPEAGSYYFQCDVHPTMNGVVEVSEDASQGDERHEPGVNATTTSTTEP